MVGIKRLVRVTQYPKPHDESVQFMVSANNGIANCTIMPALHHDEALLASAMFTHPEHASFAETDDSNCCSESKIFRISCTMRVSLTPASIATDNLQNLRFAFMTIHGAFEDFDAKDELTSITVGNVLEITKETTDRQSYPIYDGTDLTVKYAASSDLGTTGMDFALTTDSKIENVMFDPELFYDALNYYTISEKLKKVQDGLRWITLTPNNPTKLIKFNITSNTKSMNPYTILAHMFYCPASGTKYQIPIGTETSAISHLSIEYRCRFLEWNDNFQHQRA